MKCKARWMSGHAESTGKARAHGGRRADLDNRYFRSSWEANWARYLGWLKSIGEIKAWDYESDRFEFAKITRGSRLYTPDFKVVNSDGSVEFHEIKGYMDSVSATKIKRMAKYFPRVKLLVITQVEYAAVAKKVAGMLSGWETHK